MREKQYIIKYNGKHFSTIHLTAVPGISVAKGGESELASAEVQESDTVHYVGPFDLRGGQAVFRSDGGHIYIPFAQTYQPRFFYYHVKDHLGNVRVTKIGRAAPAKASATAATALMSRIQHIQKCANQQIPAAACCLYGVAVS